jgi:type I restriction enzyme S subunit
LKEIQKEKARLIKEGKIKKEKPLPEITEDEIPFEIPDNWCWVRLGDVGNYKKGPFGSSLTKSMFIPDGERSIKVYEQKNAIQKDHSIGDYYIDESYYQSTMKGFTVAGGDIIISCAGTIGESYILPSDARIGIINQALMRVRVFNCLDKSFFLKVFDYAISSKEAKGKGSAIKNIPPFEILKNILIPLPPVSEQHRIIERLEQILPELDKLYQYEAKLEALQKAFPKKMKDSILQYAIQGKLTEQIPEDGDARDLLKEIEKEKARLIKEGKIKKEKPLPEITEDEIPFEIPDNWCWVRLGAVTYNHGQKKPEREFTYIDISSVNNLENILGDLGNILKPEEAPSRARKIVHKGDVIYATVRPYLHNVCMIDREITPEPIVSTGFAVVCTPKRILNNYLFKCFLSPMFDNYANDNDNSKGVAYPAINDDKFSKALIPLPPLTEQQRIVERLDELLPLCETLE